MLMEPAVAPPAAEVRHERSAAIPWEFLPGSRALALGMGRAGTQSDLGITATGHGHINGQIIYCLSLLNANLLVVEMSLTWRDDRVG
jgi:hypothetical protein